MFRTGNVLHESEYFALKFFLNIKICTLEHIFIKFIMNAVNKIKYFVDARTVLKLIIKSYEMCLHNKILNNAIIKLWTLIL